MHAVFRGHHESSQFPAGHGVLRFGAQKRKILLHGLDMPTVFTYLPRGFSSNRFKTTFEPSDHIKRLQITLFIIPENLWGRKLFQPPISHRMPKLGARDIAKGSLRANLHDLNNMEVRDLIKHTQAQHVMGSGLLGEHFGEYATKTYQCSCNATSLYGGPRLMAC